MTITRGATGSLQTIAGGSEQAILSFPTGLNPPSSLCVKVDSTSPVAVTVRIPFQHGDTGGAYLVPGEKEYFRIGHGGINEVYVTGDTGIISWYAVAHTRAQT